MSGIRDVLSARMSTILEALQAAASMDDVYLASPRRDLATFPEEDGATAPGSFGVSADGAWRPTSHHKAAARARERGIVGETPEVNDALTALTAQEDLPAQELFRARWAVFGTGGGPDGTALLFPGDVSAAMAYTRVRDAANELVSLAAQEIEYNAAAIIEDDRVRSAALTRMDVAQRWPWPDWTPEGWLLQLLLFCVNPAVVPDEVVPDLGGFWPPDALPKTVYEWAREALNRENMKVTPRMWRDDPERRRGRYRERSTHPYSSALWIGGCRITGRHEHPVTWEPTDDLTWELTDDFGDKLLARVTRRDMMHPPPSVFFPGSTYPNNVLDIQRFPAGGLALLWLAVQSVESERQRPTAAISASREHHEFIGNAALARRLKRRDPVERVFYDGQRFAVVVPGEAVQLSLPVDGFEEGVIRDLARLKGPRTVRHWLALHVLCERAGRSSFRWSLDAHMDAMGVSDRQRQDPAKRMELAREVEALTRCELLIADERGEQRSRRALVLTLEAHEERDGEEWRLEGATLAINPALYSGVRDDSGKLGSNFVPLPAAVVTISDARYPHAHVLAALLGIRGLWDLKRGKTDLVIQANNLLNRGGFNTQDLRNDPGRVYGRLEKHLDELQRVGAIGAWQWDGPARQLGTMVRIATAQHVVDRVLHKVHPELPAAHLPTILTGSELRAWREGLGWTQSEAAQRLDVTERTLRNWEKTEQLNRGAVAKVRALLG